MHESHLYLHRSRFVDYTPPSINALAFSHPSLSKSSPIPASLRLAIGRSNGDIEIWNPLKGAWFHESTLKGGKGRSIEGLAWTQDTTSDGSQLRLFSIGYSSVVTEWDLESGRPRKHVDCNGGVIWSIAAQPRVLGGKCQSGEELRQDLVVGLDDGSVSLLSTDGGPGFLEYKRTLMRSSSAKARVLSLALKDRHTVVAGMADSTIRVWDTRSGRVVTRMTLGKEHRWRGAAKRDILVWAVKVLQNGDIVSGDSTGEVLFWDGKTYSLRQRIKAHEADALTLEVNRTGDMVVSSGVDRRTVFFGLEKGGQQKGRWAEIVGRRIHTHDVRAMAAWEGGSMSTIVSGGVDMTPVVAPFADFMKSNHRVLPAIPQKPIVTCIPESRLLMSWYDREIKIWAIEKLDNVTGALLNPGAENTGRKLISRLVLGNEENITSAHISRIPGQSSGYMLAVSTNREIKMFHLRPPKPSTHSHALRVSKVEIPVNFRVQKANDPDAMEDDSSDSDDEDEDLNLTNEGARLLQFSPDGKWLLIITPESKALLVPIQVEEKDSGTRLKVSVLLSPKVFVMNRIPRSLPHDNELQPNSQTPTKKNKTRKSPLDFGNLDSYPYTISRATFSYNSRILVVTDLSGHLDSYVLQGSKWRNNPAGSVLPKLEFPVVAMEFRPESSIKFSGQKQLPSTEGKDDSDNEASEVNNQFGEQEDRLMILTAHNQQVFEFHILKGKLTDWSRRNPPSRFINDFKMMQDLGSGIIWEIEEADNTPPGQEGKFEKERVWFWGPTWIWMFDLQQDFPDSDPAQLSSSTEANPANKRKRDVRVGSTGGIIRNCQSIGFQVGSGTLGERERADNDGDIAMQDKTKGDDDAGMSDYVDEDDNANDSRWGKFSRPTRKQDDAALPTSILDSSAADNGNANTLAHTDGDKTGRPHWRQYKYRPIMALLPIGLWNPRRVGVDGDEQGEEVHEENEEEEAGFKRDQFVKELVVVERPAWDIELPPRFFGKREKLDEFKQGVWG